MNNFQYSEPSSLDEASRQLSDDWKKSLPYAGGTDLLGLVKNHIESPAMLVNLKRLSGLGDMNFKKGKGLSIGALVKISDIAGNQLIKDKYHVLAEAAMEVASPQLRNMGTLGGNLCQRPRCWYFRGDFNCLRKGGEICFAAGGENKYHCITDGGPCYIVHPSDMAVALLALDAKINIYAAGKIKSVPVSEFFVLPKDDILRENVLKPGEIVTGVDIPELEDGGRSGYIKFKERGAWDFAIVSVAAVLKKSGTKIVNGKLAFGGVAPIPWEEKTLNAELKGELTAKKIQVIIRDIMKNAEPLEQNAYKITLTRNLTKRLLNRLI